MAKGQQTGQLASVVKCACLASLRWKEGTTALSGTHHVQIRAAQIGPWGCPRAWHRLGDGLHRAPPLNPLSELADKRSDAQLGGQGWNGSRRVQRTLSSITCTATRECVVRWSGGARGRLQSRSSRRLGQRTGNAEPVDELPDRRQALLERNRRATGLARTRISGFPFPTPFSVSRHSDERRAEDPVAP